MYQLTRVSDSLIKQSEDIKFITFDNDGRFETDLGHTPKEGASLLMSPFNEFYTWLTTPITEILESTEETIHFKTQNSEYILKTINP